MPTKITFKTSGFKEVHDKLQRLPPRAAHTVVRTGILAAVEIWLREMEFRVARATGFLAENILVKARVRTSDFSGTASVGPARQAFYAMFLEFGTTKMAAKPFIRPAFESRKHDVLEEFGIEVKAALEREGLKLNK